MNLEVHIYGDENDSNDEGCSSCRGEYSVDDDEEEGEEEQEEEGNLSSNPLTT